MPRHDTEQTCMAGLPSGWLEGCAAALTRCSAIWCGRCCGRILPGPMRSSSGSATSSPASISKAVSQCQALPLRRWSGTCSLISLTTSEGKPWWHSASHLRPEAVLACVDTKQSLLRGVIDRPVVWCMLVQDGGRSVAAENPHVLCPGQAHRGQQGGSSLCADM